MIEEIGDSAARRWGVQPGDRVAVEPFLPCGTCPVCLGGRYTAKGALGVDSPAYAQAIRIIESGQYPLARMHTHDFGLADAADAVRTLAREIPGQEAIHVAIRPWS